MAKHNEFGGKFLSEESPLRLLRMSSQSSFVRFQSIELSPEFYKIVCPSSPWKLAVRMRSMDKTSYWLEYETSCQTTGLQLVRCLDQVVQVDLETRRLVPLPVEGLEMYRRAATASPPSRFLFPNSRPASDLSFKTSIKAASSETDLNNYVNQSVYLRYCLDCANLAVMQGGVLTRFRKDMAYYNLKRFSVEYLREIKAGDEIQVMCWEDTSRAGVLCFLIETQQKTACRCVGEWYLNSDGSLVEYVNSFPDMLESTTISKI